MFRFWRTSEFVDPQLGRLKRAGNGMWYSSPPAGEVGVTVEGSREQPYPQALYVARRLIRDGRPYLSAAEAFVLQDTHALEFMRSGGALVCDGFTVFESQEFAVEFSLSDWPDAMITVPFKGDTPCEVQLAD